MLELIDHLFPASLAWHEVEKKRRQTGELFPVRLAAGFKRLALQAFADVVNEGAKFVPGFFWTLGIKAIPKADE